MKILHVSFHAKRMWLYNLKPNFILYHEYKEFNSDSIEAIYKLAINPTFKVKMLSVSWKGS